jgi:hypothetical protein
MDDMPEVIIYPTEEEDTAGRLQTAIAEFRDQLPAIHWVDEAPVGEAKPRQLLVFGATQQDGFLHLADNAWLYLETRQRRVHAFRWRGEGRPLRLPLPALGALAELAEASTRPYGPACAEIELSYGRRGWRVVGESRSHEESWLDEVDPQLGTTHLVGQECEFLRPEPDEPFFALTEIFFARYPALTGNAARAEAWRVLRSTVLALCQAFQSNLQPLALQACARLGCTSIKAFNALAHESQRVALYRAQLADAVPIVAKLLAGSEAPALLPVRLAVDLRLELAPAAAGAFGVRPAVIRSLSGVSVAEMGACSGPTADMWLEQPSLLLGALDAIEPAHRPRDPGGWAAFHALVKPLLRHREHFAALVIPFLRQAAARGLEQSLASVRRRLGHEERLGDFEAFLQHLAKAARRLRLLARDEDDKEFARRYAHGRGLLQLALESSRWRAACAREVARLMTAREARLGRDRLTLPFPVPRELDGLAIVFLDSGAALAAEGERMCHCIASLYPAAARGERLPFSVRTRAGEPLASFDISFKRGRAWRADVNEVNGPHNGQAAPEAVQAAHDFARLVGSELASSGALVEAWLERCRGRAAKRLRPVHERFVATASLRELRPIIERLRKARRARP